MQTTRLALASGRPDPHAPQLIDGLAVRFDIRVALAPLEVEGSSGSRPTPARSVAQSHVGPRRRRLHGIGHG